MTHTVERVRRSRGRAVKAAAAVTAAGVVLMGLGGCKVGTGQREPASTKVKEVLDSGQGRFDLTRPPSRDEAGMPAGRTDVTYEREDHTPFRVRVALPEGKELTLDARLVTFDAMAEADPKTAPPSTMDIHHYPATLAAGRDHLLAAAKEYGLDTKPILEWYEEAADPRPVQAPSTVRTPWLATKVGYLRLEVQGRYKPPVDAAGSDQTVVHYLFTWDPDPNA